MQAKRRGMSVVNVSTQPRPRGALSACSKAPSERKRRTGLGHRFERRARALPQSAVSGSRALSRGRGARSGRHGAARPSHEPRLADTQWRRVSILSPEAPVSFGDLAGSSPLLAIYNAGRVAQVRARPGRLGRAEIRPRICGSNRSGRRLRAVRGGARRWASPAGQPTASRLRPNRGAPASPTQSALKAAMERLVARAEQRNPLGSGDWRAARGAIAAFYAGRAYAPVWVDEDGLTRTGRAALSQLRRARDDGLNLSAFALPRDFGAGLDPDAMRRSRNDDRLGDRDLRQAGVRIARSPLACLAAHLRKRPASSIPRRRSAETATAADPARRLADFNPPQRGYRDLRDELEAPRGPGQRRTSYECGDG